MYEAVIKDNNKLISIDEFKRKYGLKSIEGGLELICPACKGAVHVYGVSSVKVAARFHHDPGNNCLYLCDVGTYLSLRLPKSWNIEEGRRIRSLLENKEFISKLYCFCLRLCGKGSLPVDKFISLIKKADKRNLWSCSGFKEWITGFLLLVLDDFEGKDKKNNSYVFRFFLQKGKAIDNVLDKSRHKIDIDEVLSGEGHLLVRVFDTGKTKDFPAGNPYGVCEKNWQDFSRDYQWAYQHQGENLVTRVKELGKI